jgi:molecular chaperone GrpE
MADNKTPQGNGPAQQTADAAAAPNELEALRARAETAEKERDQYLALAQRTRADFENYQKRLQRDQAQERRYAEGPLARDLLPVLDNLERATEAAKKVGESGPLVQGVALVLTQVLDVFRRHGITRMEALGKPVDFNLHEAVLQQPTAEQPPMTVAQVLEQGYLLHDRVLRPARVAVAVAPPQSPNALKEGQP